MVIRSKFLFLFLFFGILIAGFFLFKLSRPTVTAIIPATQTDYPLINKTVTANLGKHFIINFKPLKSELEKIQKNYPYKSYIYFSYLNSGSWIGLNEREEFTAASTIKVPIAMSLMKAVEDGKLKLSDSYALETLNLDSNFGDLYKAGADKELTIEELLKIMLEQSDNTAMSALKEVFKRIGINDPLEDIFNNLGWEFTQTIPELGEMPNYSKINLKTLTNLFITLYDAKYISVEDSNKILEYLTNTPFNDRIVAGVSKDVAVSHKIGTASGDNTFSDCGIIYAPNRHYVLCLGSSGDSEKGAARFMGEVSGAVYKYVMNN